MDIPSLQRIAYRQPYRCPLCTWREAKPYAKNGICRSCRTDERLYPVNFAGRRRKPKPAESDPAYAYV